MFNEWIIGAWNKFYSRSPWHQIFEREKTATITPRGFSHWYFNAVGSQFVFIVNRIRFTLVRLSRARNDLNFEGLDFTIYTQNIHINRPKRQKRRGEIFLTQQRHSSSGRQASQVVTQAIKQQWNSRGPSRECWSRVVYSSSRLWFWQVCDFYVRYRRVCHNLSVSSALALPWHLYFGRTQQ